MRIEPTFKASEQFAETLELPIPESSPAGHTAAEAQLLGQVPWNTRAVQSCPIIQAGCPLSRPRGGRGSSRCNDFQSFWVTS